MIKYILLPFSWLYGIITDVRNYLYNQGLFKSKSFEIPIINVGNITVGGTGKSPQVEYLIRLLQDSYNIATLSRGYGRKTKGFILADNTANAETIGDEPMQFYLKFSDKITVVVGENRVESIQQIIKQKPDTRVIILDDAFQHRAVKPSLNILLIDYNRPIDEDYPFPAGRLRERRHGAKRADMVVITKCSIDLNLEEKNSLKNRLIPYLKEHTPVLFTKILYGKPIDCRSTSGTLKENEAIVLISGIAKPKLLENYVRKNFKITSQLIFKDHHSYSEKDIDLILSNLSITTKAILMTEKDMVKFKPFLNHERLKDISLYYLPIKIGFLDESERLIFDNLVQNSINHQLNFP